MAITLGTNGYCEATDVQARVQQYTINTTSKPTTAQTESQITEDFNMINGYLDTAGYTIPVAVGTYTKAGSILKQINRDLTVAFVYEAVYSATGGGSPNEAAILRDRVDAQLKLLASGKLSLIDAPKESDAVVLLNEQVPTAEFNLDDDGDETDSTFTRTTEW